MFVIFNIHIYFAVSTFITHLKLTWARHMTNFYVSHTLWVTERKAIPQEHDRWLSWQLSRKKKYNIHSGNRILRETSRAGIDRLVPTCSASREIGCIDVYRAMNFFDSPVGRPISRNPVSRLFLVIPTRRWIFAVKYYILMGLWWNGSNDTRFINSVKTSLNDPRGGLKSLVERL